MGTLQTNMTPSADILLQECPRARVLVLGKSGAGKSALINAVFGTELTNVSDNKGGVHEIEREFFSPSNERLVVHDSEGFEAGDGGKLEKVLTFIKTRSEKSNLGDRLHAIWVCAEIPHAGGRLLEAGVEEVLKRCPESLPVIVVFTKLDVLETRAGREVFKLVREGTVARDRIQTNVHERVNSLVEELCVSPLRELVEGREYPWVTVSTRPKFDYTIKDLISLALEQTQLESVWLSLAIAQRSKAEESLKASVKVGRKKWWGGLFSDVFLGLSMRKVISVLHLDIVKVWNMNDPEKYLISPQFLALITVLVEDLYEHTITDYTLTKEAAQALVQNPMLIPVTGPTLAVAFVVEWITGSYNKTKSSLRCMAAFIIDLSLTMDTLFYLVRGGQPLTVRLINMALMSYQTRKAPVHDKIRSWIDRLESKFEHLNPSLAIDRMVQIIEEHCIKPNIEKGTTRQDGGSTTDEPWISGDDLRQAV